MFSYKNYIPCKKKLTLECNMHFHKTEIRFQKIITVFIVRSFPKRWTNCHM